MPITWTGLSGPDTTITVEIGFDTDPFIDPTTWTDVTDYVALEDGPVQIDRGRSDAQSVADAGTCTFVLNNDDKRFTPGYTGGPYGSNVKVGRRVRVSIYHNSTTYERFSGYISSYDLSWPGGVTEQSRVAVTAVDILGYLAQVKLRNIVEHTFLLSAPVALWPLDDADESDDAQEITGYRQDHLHPVHNKAGGHAKHGGISREFADGDIQFGESKGLPSIPPKDSRSLRVKSPRKWEDDYGWTALGAGGIDLQGATTSVAFGVWVNFDQEHDEDQTVYLASLKLADGGGFVNGQSVLAAAVSTKGRAYAGVLDNDGIMDCEVRGPRIVTGGWHFLYVHYTETGSGVVSLYVDGELEGTSSAHGTNFPLIPTDTTVTVGAARQYDGDKEDNNPANARFSYFGVWVDDEADALDPDEMWTAGITGWDGSDRTSDRVQRVLKWIGLPDGRRDVERGISEVRIGDMKNLTALEYINECVIAEQGFFFQAGDGTATFHARDHRWEGQATAELEWHHPDERFTTDVEQFVNTVTVSYRGGEMRQSDAASLLAHGPRELSVDTQLSDRNQARGIAEYVLKLRESQRPRLDSFTYDVLTEPDVDVRDDVLALELNTMVTLSSLPTQAHTTSASYWVEGISETLSIDEWRVTFTTTPHKTDFEGFWVLGGGVSDLGTYSVLGY